MSELVQAVEIDDKQFQFRKFPAGDGGSEVWDLYVPPSFPNEYADFDKTSLPTYAKLWGIEAGIVGRISVNNRFPKDRFRSISLDSIASHTMHLSETAPQRGVSGIGSFLLDQLCSYADDGQKRVYINAYSMSHKLDQIDLVRWYRKRGFVRSKLCPPTTRHGEYTMQREPMA